MSVLRDLTVTAGGLVPQRARSGRARLRHERMLGLGKLETQAAHAEHDRSRNDAGGDGACDHEAVRESLLAPCDIITTRVPAARCERMKKH